MSTADADITQLLVCPMARARLVRVGDWLYSTDRDTRRRYPVIDGIPVLLDEQAQQVDLGDFDRVIRSL